jgi:hypothetical protein
MMTHKEFHERARVLAAGSYFSTNVDVTEDSAGKLELEYGLYVNGHGWHKAKTPELALASFVGTPVPVPKAALDSLDPAPSGRRIERTRTHR